MYAATGPKHLENDDGRTRTLKMESVSFSSSDTGFENKFATIFKIFMFLQDDFIQFLEKPSPAKQDFPLADLHGIPTAVPDIRRD